MSTIPVNWKNSLFQKGKKRVASIPFARNLVEYTIGDSDTNYMKLTSLLHWKEDSSSITQADLDDVYRNVFGKSDTFVGDPKERVVDCIEKEAKACLNGNGGNELEAKVVLSIGIRLAAEKFMVEKITDVDFKDGITNNQTRALLQRFENDFGSKDEALSTLRKVALMTPENIHLNAFMYEPLLDMSDDSLRSLYSDVCNLKYSLPSPNSPSQAPRPKAGYALREHRRSSRCCEPAVRLLRMLTASMTLCSNSTMANRWRGRDSAPRPRTPWSPATWARPSELGSPSPTTRATKRHCPWRA